MAEKKEHKIVSASGDGTTRKAAPGVAAQQIAQSTVGLRIGSVVLWILALVAEFYAIKSINPDGKVMGMAPFTALIVFLIVDLICVIAGSLLWKKANHIHPASEKNALTFWLWNNLGVIMAALAFIPFVILLLTNKNADKRTKTIGTIVAVIAMLIAGGVSYDYEPYSEEQQQELKNLEDAGAQVYWTKYGKKFHFYEDCYHLDRTDSLTVGNTLQAQDAGKKEACSTCLNRHKKETAEAAAQVSEEGQSALEEAVDTATKTVETVKEEVTEAVEE